MLFILEYKLIHISNKRKKYLLNNTQVYKLVKKKGLQIKSITVEKFLRFKV